MVKHSLPRGRRLGVGPPGGGSALSIRMPVVNPGLPPAAVAALTARPATTASAPSSSSSKTSTKRTFLSAFPMFVPSLSW